MKPVQSSTSSSSSGSSSGMGQNISGSGLETKMMSTRLGSSFSGSADLDPQQDLYNSKIALENALESKRIAERDLLKSKFDSQKISELRSEVENGNIGYKELIDKYKNAVGKNNFDLKLNIDALADEDNMAGRNTRLIGEQNSTDQSLGFGSGNGNNVANMNLFNGNGGNNNLSGGFSPYGYESLASEKNGYQNQVGNLQNQNSYVDSMLGIPGGFEYGSAQSGNDSEKHGNAFGKFEGSSNGSSDPRMPGQDEKSQFEYLKNTDQNPEHINLLKTPPKVIHALNADRMRYLSPENHWRYRIVSPGTDKKILVVTRDLQTGLTDYLTLKHLKNDCSTVDFFNFNLVKDKSGVYPFYTLSNKNIALGLEKNTLTAIPSNFDRVPFKFRQKGNLFEIMKDDMCLTRTFKDVEGIENLILERCGNQAQLFDLQEILPSETFDQICHCSSCKDNYHTGSHFTGGHSGMMCHLSERGCGEHFDDAHEHFASDSHFHHGHEHPVFEEHFVHPHIRSGNFLHFHQKPHGHIEHLVSTHNLHHDTHLSNGLHGHLHGSHLENPHGHMNHGYVLTPRHVY